MTDSSIYAEIAKAVPVIIGGALAAVAGVATQFVTHHLAISRDKGNVKRERLESFREGNGRDRHRNQSWAEFGEPIPMVRG